MLPESLKEIIDFAIEKEAESASFYRNSSDLAEQAHIKKLFEEMAAEEEKHKMLLEGLDEEMITKTEIKKVPTLGIAELLSETSFGPSVSYDQALALAIKNEEKSVRLYEGLAEHTEDAQLKKLFQILTQEEAKHRLKLEKVYSDEVFFED
jgi:rubrerythrin